MFHYFSLYSSKIRMNVYNVRLSVMEIGTISIVSKLSVANLLKSV